MERMAAKNEYSLYERVMQKLAVAHFVFIWLLMPFVTMWLPVYMLFTRLWWYVRVREFVENVGHCA